MLTWRFAGHVRRLIGGILVTLAFTQVALAERRVALVIGNSQYRNPALNLSNPQNDARDVAAVLQGFEFEVMQATDVDKRQLDRLLQDFARRAVGADAAVFFYAGHAMQHLGRNYLVPVDAELVDHFSLRSEAVAIDEVREALEHATGIKVLILDACRDNPLTARVTGPNVSRNVVPVRGLARIDSPGMIVAYATQANAVADDGTGRNSPFTASLLKHMPDTQLEIGVMFRRVGAEVLARTSGRQRPEISMSYFGEFYLAPRDRVAWETIKDTADAAVLLDFVTRFPASTRAMDARRRLQALQQREQAAREQAERERLAREQAERERLAREQTERERLAREQAERERLAREQEERERLAREQAEREALAKKAKVSPPVQTALLTPPAESPPPEQAAPGRRFVQDIQRELQRLGCYDGEIDDQWSRNDVRESVRKFAKHANLADAPDEPSQSFLDLLRGNSGRLCPLQCAAGQVERQGRCVARTCGAGQVLDANGNCVRAGERKKIDARPAKRARPVAWPARAPAPVPQQPAPEVWAGGGGMGMGGMGGMGMRGMGRGWEADLRRSNRLWDNR